MKIDLINKTYEVIINYKQLKRINLSFQSPNVIYISSPRKLDYDKIKKILDSNLSWLIKQENKISFLKANNLVLKGVNYQLVIDNNLLQPYQINNNIIKYRQNGLSELITQELNKIEILFNELAQPYPKVKLSFRRMKSRWGVCKRQKKNITLNSFIIMLPDELIKYIIYHELTHLKIHNHQKEFYFELAKVLSNYKELQKKLKDYTLL